MSSLSEQDPLNPNDQLYYAPRWLRERSEPVPPLPSAVPSPSAEKKSESLARPIPNSPPHSFDALLEEAVAESLRHPLDPQVMNEPPGFVRELDRRMAILSVAGRFAAAIGVSAIVALFFVIMVPASRDYSRQPERLQSFRRSSRHPPPPPRRRLFPAKSRKRCFSSSCNGSKSLRSPPRPDHAIG